MNLYHYIEEKLLLFKVLCFGACFSFVFMGFITTVDAAFTNLQSISYTTNPALVYCPPGQLAVQPDEAQFVGGDEIGIGDSGQYTTGVNQTGDLKCADYAGIAGNPIGPTGAYDSHTYSYSDQGTTTQGEYMTTSCPAGYLVLQPDEAQYVGGNTIGNGDSGQYTTGVSQTGSMVCGKWDDVLPTATTPTDEGTSSADLTLDFSWTSADADSGVATHEICISTDQSACTPTQADIAATSYRWNGASWGVSYYAQLRTTDVSGNVGAWSAWSDGVKPDDTNPEVYDISFDANTGKTQTVRFYVVAYDADAGLSPTATKFSLKTQGAGTWDRIDGETMTLAGTCNGVDDPVTNCAVGRSYYYYDWTVTDAVDDVVAYTAYADVWDAAVSNVTIEEADVGFAVINSIPSNDSVTVSAATLGADASTVYTMTQVVTDNDGWNHSAGGVDGAQVIINQGGTERGRFGWDNNSYLWSKNQFTCSGSGGYASQIDAGSGTEYINLAGCSSSVSAGTLTINYTFTLNANYGDIQNNDIASFVYDEKSVTTGWDNFDINFTVVPAPISNLAVTFSHADQDIQNYGKLKLDWIDNSDVTETGFRVERSTDNATWSTVTTTLTGVETYTDTGLDPNDQYYYRVYAVNSGGDALSAPTDNKYTVSKVPVAPTISLPVSTTDTDSLIIDNVGENGNPSTTEYALVVDSDNDATSFNVMGYLKADGTLETNACTFGLDDLGSCNMNDLVWQTQTTWENTDISGLSTNTINRIKVMARNGDGITTLWGNETSINTRAAIPGAPTVKLPLSTTDTDSVVFTVVDVNGNPVSAPSDTLFAIQVDTDDDADFSTNAQYLADDGSLSVTEVWQTQSAWQDNTDDTDVDSGQGIDISGISANNYVMVRVKARNENDNVETPFGTSTNLYTRSITAGQPVMSLSSNKSHTEHIVVDTITGAGNSTHTQYAVKLDIDGNGTWDEAGVKYAQNLGQGKAELGDSLVGSITNNTSFDFSTESDYSYESLMKGTCEKFVVDTVNISGHFTDASDTAQTIGTGNQCPHIVVGTRFKISSNWYEILEIINDGSGNNEVVFSGGGIAANTYTVTEVAGTIFESGFLKMNKYFKNDNTIAYWKMDELSWNGTAGEVIDLSGNFNSGTSSGGVNNNSTEKFGNAGLFDGVDDYIQVTDSATTNGLTSKMTLSAWIKPDDVPTNSESIIVSKKGAYGIKVKQGQSFTGEYAGEDIEYDATEITNGTDITTCPTGKLAVQPDGAQLVGGNAIGTGDSGQYTTGVAESGTLRCANYDANADDVYVEAFVNGTSVDAYLVDGWNYVVMTYDATEGSNQLKLYVNGVLQRQANESNNIGSAGVLAGEYNWEEVTYADGGITKCPTGKLVVQPDGAQLVGGNAIGTGDSGQYTTGVNQTGTMRCVNYDLAATSNIWIGEDYKGVIDDLAMFDTDITAEDIASIYDESLAIESFFGETFVGTLTTINSSLDNTAWTSLEYASVSEALNGGESWYSVSFDGDEYKVWDGSAWRIIASKLDATTGLSGGDSGKWAFRDNADTWTLAETAGVDQANSAISQAIVYANNQMTAAELAAVTTLQWNGAGGYADSQSEIYFATTIKTTSVTDNPKVDSIIVNKQAIGGWATKAGWEGTEIEGLPSNTLIRMKVMARNTNDDVQADAWSVEATPINTRAVIPSIDLTLQSEDSSDLTTSRENAQSLDIAIDPRANPSTTEYAIYIDIDGNSTSFDSGYYVTTGGTASAVTTETDDISANATLWQTESAWEAVDLKNLNLNDEMRVKIKARNNNENVETAFSAEEASAGNFDLAVGLLSATGTTSPSVDNIQVSGTDIDFSSPGDYSQEDLSYTASLNTSGLSGAVTLTLTAGTWDANGKIHTGCTVSGNDGVAVITAEPANQTTITATTTTDFSSVDSMAAGTWSVHCTQVASGSASLISNANIANTIYTLTTSDTSRITGTKFYETLITETLNGETTYYAVSSDDRKIWKIWDAADNDWRNIVRDYFGVWQYNTAGAGLETWADCSINTGESCLSEAFALAQNQMNITTLQAHFDYEKIVTRADIPLAAQVNNVPFARVGDTDSMALTVMQYGLNPRAGGGIYTKNIGTQLSSGDVDNSGDLGPSDRDDTLYQVKIVDKSDSDAVYYLEKHDDGTDGDGNTSAGYIYFTLATGDPSTNYWYTQKEFTNSTLGGADIDAILEHQYVSYVRAKNQEDLLTDWGPEGPAEIDRDNDGIPDWWETANSLDPDNPDDAGADTDGDDVSNYYEYLNSPQTDIYDVWDAGHAPTGLTGIAVSTTSIYWSWTRGNAESHGYQVLDENGTVISETGANSFLEVNLTKSTTYARRIKERYDDAWFTGDLVSATTLTTNPGGGGGGSGYEAQNADIQADKTAGTWYNSSDITFSSADLVAGNISNYRYIWNQSATITETTLDTCVEGTDWPTGTLSQTLSAGNNYLHVIVCQGGSPTTSGISTYGPYNYDASAPSVVVVQLNSGASYTNSTSVTVLTVATDTGDALVKDMQFKVDGGTATDYEAYNPFKIVTLTEGAHTVNVQVRDSAGNESGWSSDETITVDSSGITLGAIQAKTTEGGESITADTWWSDSTPYFTWPDITVGASGVAGYSVLMKKVANPADDGTFDPDSVVDTTDDYYEYTAPLSDGRYVLKVKAQNNAGAWSAVQSFIFKLDATAPTVTSIFPTAGGGLTTADWTAASGEMNGTSSDVTSGLQDIKYSLQDSDGNYHDGTSFANTTETWLDPEGTVAAWNTPTMSIPSDGSYTLQVKVHDNSLTTAGVYNETIESVSFSIDNTAPNNPTISPSTAIKVGSASVTGVKTQVKSDLKPTISTEANAKVFVKVNGAASYTEYVADSSGKFTFSSAIPLTQLEPTIEFYVEDAAGNQSEVIIAYYEYVATLTSISPTVASRGATLTLTGSNLKSGTNPTVTFTGAASATSIDSYVDNGDSTETITVTIPADAESGSVVVNSTTLAGLDSNGLYLTIMKDPTSISVAPSGDAVMNTGELKVFAAYAKDEDGNTTPSVGYLWHFDGVTGTVRGTLLADGTDYSLTLDGSSATTAALESIISVTATASGTGTMYVTLDNPYTGVSSAPDPAKVITVYSSSSSSSSEVACTNATQVKLDFKSIDAGTPLGIDATNTTTAYQTIKTYTGSQTTKINNYVGAGTVISEDLYAGNATIQSVMLRANATVEGSSNITYYVAADADASVEADPNNWSWEEVQLNQEHVLSTSGKALRWKAVMTGADATLHWVTLRISQTTSIGDLSLPDGDYIYSKANCSSSLYQIGTLETLDSGIQSVNVQGNYTISGDRNNYDDPGPIGVYSGETDTALIRKYVNIE